MYNMHQMIIERTMWIFHLKPKPLHEYNKFPNSFQSPLSKQKQF